MRRLVHGRFPVWVLLGLLSAGVFDRGGQIAFAQEGNPAPQRSAVVLDTNTEVVKRLATVEDHIKERQWAQAILILQQVAADQGDTLIAINPRRYLNVATYCNSVLANLPPEGLAVYREKYDAQAKHWLETGLAARDRLLLEKIVRQAFISSSGDDALYWLGEWAWDQSDFAAARDYWRQLLELQNPPDVGQPQSVLRFPDSSYSQAAVIARIVLCHILEGDRELAQNWLAYLAKKHPEAQGELAGRSGSFAEILKEVLWESRGWKFPKPTGDVPTFAGNAQRNLISPKQPELGGVQWELPLPEHHFNPASKRMGIGEPSLSYFPAVVNNTVFLADPDRIYAFDLLSGRAKWPRAGDGAIKDRKDLEMAAIYQSSRNTLSGPQYRLGVPRFTVTVHEDRLYARMGSPVTGQISKSTATPDSHVVCLDLTKEGKLVWFCQPDDVLAGLKTEARSQWAFEGTPIVAGGRAFVALRQSHPQTDAMVACLDAGTGKPQWTRRVASASANIGEAQNYLSHHLLTLGENMVFFMPEFGAVTALDAGDGRLLWAVTYPSVSPKDSPTLEDPHLQGLTPCVFHQGVVYAAPTDSESILAIAAKTGVILWEQTILFKHDHIRHVLGVVKRPAGGEDKEKLVLSGNELWILDAATGNILAPKFPTPGRQPEFYGSGRGAIAGQRIFFPTRSAIEVRKLTGERSGQPKAHAGGNLTVVGDMMLVAEPERLVAYSNFAQVKQAQEKLVSQNPQAALPRFRVAQIEEATGEWRKALKHYEEAIALAAPADVIASQPLKAAAAQKRFQLLMRLGRKQLADQTPQLAVEEFQQAVKSSPDDSSRAEALRSLGESQRQIHQTQDAVRSFQLILDEPKLAELPFPGESHRTFGQFAEQQIASLIRSHGREAYAEFDRLASEQIGERLKSRDLKGVELILRRFPNALISTESRHQVALLKRDRGDPWAALISWRRILNETTAPQTRRDVLLELARTLEQRGYLRPAAERWRQLAIEFPQSSIPSEGQSVSALAFVPAHLRSELYQQTERHVPHLPLMRRWERDRAEESQVILPTGEPPSPLLACAFVDNHGVACVDQHTGGTRWQKQFDERAVWSAYAGTHLLIGTAKFLHAVTLEAGESLWRVSLSDSDEADGPPRFQFVQDRVLVLQSAGVSCRDANTGDLIWNASPPGTLSDTLFADADFVVVQTHDPLSVLVLDAKTGQWLSEHQFSEPWLAPPVRLKNSETEGFAASLANWRIRAFAASGAQADPHWIYQGAASHANTTPRLWSREGRLLMLMDGETLIGLAPETGRPLWDYALASGPLSDPEQAVAFDEARVYAAEGHTLHCLGWNDGRVLWKHHLPDAPAWAMRKSGRFLIAAPWETAGTLSQAVIVDANTGERVQELQLPPRILALDFRPASTLVVTKTKLVGLGPLRF